MSTVAPKPNAQKFELPSGEMQWGAFYPGMKAGVGDTEEWAVSDYYAKNNTTGRYPRKGMVTE